MRNTLLLRLGHVPKLNIRQYYPKPTPMDLGYEEGYTNTQAAYSHKEIYEWDIDGMTEYQKISMINRMLMYATTCKITGNSDKNITILISSGFMGQLKGWWDHILTRTQQIEIINTVKIKVEGTTQTNEEDVVYTLCQAIIKQFIGQPLSQDERSKKLLMNLRCPTLTH